MSEAAAPIAPGASPQRLWVSRSRKASRRSGGNRWASHFCIFGSRREIIKADRTPVPMVRALPETAPRKPVMAAGRARTASSVKFIPLSKSADRVWWAMGCKFSGSFSASRVSRDRRRERALEAVRSMSGRALARSPRLRNMAEHRSTSSPAKRSSRMPTASTLAPALGIFREKNFTAGSASSASVPPRKKGKNSGKSQRIPSQAAPKTQKRANVRRH